MQKSWRVSQLSIVIAMGVFLFSVSRFVAARFAKSPAPVMGVLPDSVELGAVIMGHPVQRRFLIQNTGDARLLITDVQSTCQCTVAELPARAVAAGASVQMLVTFNARTTGPLEQEVLVKSNDPVTPVRIVKLTANATTQPTTMQPATTQP